MASQILMSLSEWGYSVNMSKWMSPLKTDLISLPITRMTEVYIVIIDNPFNTDEYLSQSI